MFFFCSESTTTYPGVAESHVFFPEKKHLLALLCVIQGMNVSHHSDPVRGADGAVSWVHGFHRSGCVVPSWQSPRFFSKAFLMLRDPLKQSLGDGGDGKMCRPVRLFLQAVTSKVLQSLESYTKM